MFRRFKLDITGYARAGANNCIAIKFIRWIIRASRLPAPS